MSNIIELTVEKSVETKNGNFMNKLVGKGEDVKTAFGMVESGKRTFYLFTDQKNQKGLKAEVDLNHFDIVQREYEFVDEETGEEKVANLNYLYPVRK